MAFFDLIHRVAAEIPAGIPSGIPGTDVAVDALRKIGAADSTYAPLFVLSMAIIAVLSWVIWRGGKDTRETLERVVTAIERTNTSVAALEAMKSAVTALGGAVHDLAREAEGEARDGRHALGNIMQVVTYNGELMKRGEAQIDELRKALDALRSQLLNRGRAE